MNKILMATIAFLLSTTTLAKKSTLNNDITVSIVGEAKVMKLFRDEVRSRTVAALKQLELQGYEIPFSKIPIDVVKAFSMATPVAYQDETVLIQAQSSRLEIMIGLINVLNLSKNDLGSSSFNKSNLNFHPRSGVEIKDIIDIKEKFEEAVINIESAGLIANIEKINILIYPAEERNKNWKAYSNAGTIVVNPRAKFVDIQSVLLSYYSVAGSYYTEAYDGIVLSFARGFKLEELVQWQESIQRILLNFSHHEFEKRFEKMSIKIIKAPKLKDMIGVRVMKLEENHVQIYITASSTNKEVEKSLSPMFKLTH